MLGFLIFALWLIIGMAAVKIKEDRDNKKEKQIRTVRKKQVRNYDFFILDEKKESA